LSFQQLEGVHTGANIAARVFNILDQYDIADKLFCITTDNVSNNKKCMKKLSKMLQKRKDITWDYRAKHISCLNHIINIAVQEFLKKCKVLNLGDFDPYIEEDSDGNTDESDMEGCNDDDDDDDDQGDSLDEDEESASIADIAIEGDQEVQKAAQSFQLIIWKFRELAKVRNCSIQIGNFSCTKLLFVCYDGQLSEMS